MTPPVTPSPAPAMSVVVVSAGTFANIRRTVGYLRRQTIADRLELLMVASSAEALADVAADELDRFVGVQIVPVGPVENVDVAAASAVPKASAGVVAIVEDHGFPEPGWAESILAAHEQGFGVVGSAVVNANPRGILSWANMLIAYGPWTDPTPGGEMESVGGHNVSFHRDLLTPFGDRLGRMLQREGGLLGQLKKRGVRFYLPADAKLAHLNPSSWASTTTLRFYAGRLYADKRAREAGWNLPRRIVYVLLGPLIPPLRMARMWPELIGRGRRRGATARATLGLAVGLTLDAIGQMTGYIAGPGRALRVLSTFEMDRAEHLSRADRLRFERGGES